jgi:hypothetical protein
MASLSSMFPFSANTTEDVYLDAMDILNDLREKFEEFELISDEDSQTAFLIASGETENIKVLHDTDEVGNLVFRAQFITYCPQREISSEYHDDPEVALTELSGLVKADLRKSKRKHLKVVG